MMETKTTVLSKDDVLKIFINKGGLSIMSIKMPEKKFPQISVNQTTYVELDNLKFELRARSLDSHFFKPYG